MVALINHAHDRKQGSGGDAVVDHLQRTAAGTQPIEGKQTQHAESQVAHAGIGDQPFDIRLGQGDQRPINDSGYR